MKRLTDGSFKREPTQIVIDSDADNEAAPNAKFQCRRHGCAYRHADGVHKEHGYCCNACRRGDQLHTKNCTGAYKEVRKSSDTTVPGVEDRDCNSRGLPSRCEFQVMETRFDDGPFTIIQYINRMFRTYGNDPASAELMHIWRRVECLAESDLFSHRLKVESYQHPPIIHVYQTTNVPPRHADACIVCGKPKRDARISNGVCLDDRFFLYHPHPPWMAKTVTGLDPIVQMQLLRDPACALIVEECILRRELMYGIYGTKDLVLSCNGATHRSVGMALLLAQLIYSRARVSFHQERIIRLCQQSYTMKQYKPQ